VYMLKDVPASVHHSPEQIRVGTRTRRHVAYQVNNLQPQCLHRTQSASALTAVIKSSHLPVNCFCDQLGLEMHVIAEDSGSSYFCQLSSNGMGHIVVITFLNM